jgi:hypothetical protein
MPNGTLGNHIEELPATSVVEEAALSRAGTQNEMTASPQSESEAIASLWGLYLAHQFKASLMSGRYQEPNAFQFREHVRPFDRVVLNKLIHITQKLYKENVISSEQYSSAIVAATNIYVEQFISVRLDGYLGKASRYLANAFRGASI